MSIESLSIAFNHSRAEGTARMVLFGIANHDGDGGAWPSIATLAKYARCDRRTAQRAIPKLVALGEIRVMRNGGGSDPDKSVYERPNLYRFLLECPPDCDRTSRHRTRRDRAHATLSIPMDEMPPPSEAMDEMPPGVADEMPPEPSSNPSKTDHASHVGERARELRVQEPCPTTGQRHRLSPAQHVCADCLVPPAQWRYREVIAA